jgi:hypothetical protein
VLPFSEKFLDPTALFVELLIFDPIDPGDRQCASCVPPVVRVTHGDMFSIIDVIARHLRAK